MSATDDTLFETMIRVENKDIFVDLKKNKGGVYLKISERNGNGRNTVLIPASGIVRLRSVLDEVSKASSKVKSVSRERKSRAAGDPEIVSRSIYVSGLTWDTTEEELQNHFSEVGTVVRAVILRQRRGGNTKSSMGCGVVEFARQEQAAAALSTMTESDLKGRKVYCREDRVPTDEEASASDEPADASATATAGAGAGAGAKAETRVRAPKKAPRSEEDRVADPCKVFVSGLTWETTNEDLLQYFSAAGRVVSAEVLSTRKGRSMGSGIVEFTDAATVGRVVAQFNGADCKGRKIGVRQYFQ